jgi:hypothetical protein
MLLIYAKDDGFGVPIGLLEELREMARDRLRASFERDKPFKILGAIFSVGDFPAVV